MTVTRQLQVERKTESSPAKDRRSTILCHETNRNVFQTLDSLNNNKDSLEISESEESLRRSVSENYAGGLGTRVTTNEHTEAYCICRRPESGVMPPALHWTIITHQSLFRHSVHVCIH